MTYPPSTQPGFHRRRGGKETRQCANAQQCVCSRCPDPSLPSRSDAQVALQSHKHIVSKISRLHEKSYSSDHQEQNLHSCQKCARKQRATIVGDLPGEGRRWGKIRPAGTISREVMRRESWGRRSLRWIHSTSSPHLWQGFLGKKF